MLACEHRNSHVSGPGCKGENGVQGMMHGFDLCVSSTPGYGERLFSRSAI
jgi:hypothetical protein